METELKEMLKNRVEDVRAEPQIPRPMLRRARRRRALTAATAGLTVAIVVAGAVVGVRAAFHEQPKRVPIQPGPSPSGTAEHFPGIWPVATQAEVTQLE